MGGEEELNREMEQFKTEVDLRTQHISKKCFAQFENDDIKFTECCQLKKNRINESLIFAPWIVLFSKIKFGQCVEFSTEPQFCYLEIHQLMKEQFTSIIQKIDA